MYLWRGGLPRIYLFNRVKKRGKLAQKKRIARGEKEKLEEKGGKMGKLARKVGDRRERKNLAEKVGKTAEKEEGLRIKKKIA